VQGEVTEHGIAQGLVLPEAVPLGRTRRGFTAGDPHQVGQHTADGCGVQDELYRSAPDVVRIALVQVGLGTRARTGSLSHAPTPFA